ncbi:MAG: hypothetical protein R2865_07090 [Deinococcales bacterium]
MFGITQGSCHFSLSQRASLAVLCVILIMGLLGYRLDCQGSCGAHLKAVFFIGC